MNSMRKRIIIQASARAEGDTHRVVRHMAEEFDASVIDLLDYTIYPFSYDQSYPDDDQFLEVYHKYVLANEHLIFATPVYWYTMSGLLKNFLDRFSDLLMTHKDLGRQLRGKELSVISVANDEEVPAKFFAPFFSTAKYLGMQYGRIWHGYVESDRVRYAEQLPF